MKTNSLLSLIVILLAAVGMSIWLIKKDAGELATTEPLLGAFSNQLSQLDHITLKTAGSTLFQASKMDQQWFASHLGEGTEFPVDLTELSDFITSLQTAKLSEAKTQNPQNYSRLGVEPVEQQDSTSRLLVLGAQNESFEVLLGNASSNSFGTFIRQPEQQQSWLLDQVLDLPTDIHSWLQNPILNIELIDVMSAQRVGDDGWLVSMNGQQGLELQFIADNESLKYPTVIENSLTAMLTVQFDQAIPIESAQLPENASAELLFETINGTLSISVFEGEEQNFVVYRYAHQQWLNDWVFSLSSFNSGQLTKSRSDFVDVADDSENESDVTEAPVSE